MLLNVFVESLLLVPLLNLIVPSALKKAILPVIVDITVIGELTLLTVNILYIVVVSGELSYLLNNTSP